MAASDPTTLKESILTKLTLLIMSDPPHRPVTGVFADIHSNSSLRGSIIGADDTHLDEALDRLLKRKMEEESRRMSKKKNPTAW